MNKTQTFINLLSNDKFMRDIWIRWIDRNDIPSEEKLNDVIEMLETYHTLFPELKQIKTKDIIKDKILIHHTLYDVYDREPGSIEASNRIIDKVISIDTDLSMKDLLKIVSNQFYVGRDDEYLSKKLKEISHGKFN